MPQSYFFLLALSSVAMSAGIIPKGSHFLHIFMKIKRAGFVFFLSFMFSIFKNDLYTSSPYSGYIFRNSVTSQLFATEAAKDVLLLNAETAKIMR